MQARVEKLSKQQFYEYAAKLGFKLDDQLTVDSVNQRFRKTSIIFHPDKNLNNPQAEINFKDLVAKRDALIAHLQVYGDYSSVDENTSVINKPAFTSNRKLNKNFNITSLDDALNYSFEIISNVSPIQRRLLTTLINAIIRERELKKLQFDYIFNVINGVKKDITNAIDEEDEDATAVILTLIKHIHFLLEEIHRLYSPSTNTTSNALIVWGDLGNAFQASLNHLQYALIKIQQKMMGEFCEFVVTKNINNRPYSADGYVSYNNKYENDEFVIWCYSKEGEDKWYVAGHNDDKKRIVKEISPDQINDKEAVANAIGRTIFPVNDRLENKEYLRLTNHETNDLRQESIEYVHSSELINNNQVKETKIDKLSRKINTQIVDYKLRRTNEGNARFYKNESNIKLWTDKILVLGAANLFLNNSRLVDSNRLETMKTTNSRWDEGVIAKSLMDEVMKIKDRPINWKDMNTERRKLYKEVYSQIQIYKDQIRNENRAWFFKNESNIRLWNKKIAVLEVAILVLKNEASPRNLQEKELENENWSDGKVAKGLADKVKIMMFIPLKWNEHDVYQSNESNPFI